MAFLFYHGEGTQADHPVTLPQARNKELTNPEHYRADPGLRDACNVALYLRQPLLLTGEPGTGKTQFAHSLAWELRLGETPNFEPLRFETKSTSTARDLFYTYDAIGRFHDVQSMEGKAPPILDYLTYHALGKAILLSNDPADVAGCLNFPHTTPRQSVVLIDEVDKAPRDFPNDILNELDRSFFRIPELDGAEIPANPQLAPIVIITSNSERDLPDAFLRRCIYYHIPFPTTDTLREIVVSRLDAYLGQSDAFLDDALSLFKHLREQRSLRKKPATAELLGWILTLRELGKGEKGDKIDNPLTNLALVERTLSTLVKTKEDQDKALKTIVPDWHRATYPSEV
jgi:MoxR-like ATPase